MKKYGWSAILSLSLLGCGGGEPVPSEPPPAVRRDLPDVLLITLDTTRADRIGAYGYELARTENIDRLAASGLRYDRAYSPLPLTIPSHAALFTGMYPARLGIRSNGDGILGEEFVTLTERLKEAGYHTAASVAAFVTTRTWGFAQGFDAYFDDVKLARDFWHAERPGEEVVDDLLAWKASLPEDDDRPIFAWAHLYDAHFPYAPPQPWLDEAGGRPYDGELAYVDDQVGRLLEAFSSRPTLVIVLSDHGEGLGQHGELTHGLYTYDSTQRVPLIIAGPGVEPGVVEEAVSLVDVAPTVLSLLNLPPLEDVDGRVAPGEPARPVHIESWQLAQRFGIAPHQAVVFDGYKLIDLPQPELYDATGADPIEATNLAEQHLDQVVALREKLEAFGFGQPGSDPAHPIAPDVAAQLAALGYVEGSFHGDLAGPLPDPKEREELLQLVQKAEVYQLERRYEELLAVVEKLATDYPEVPEFSSRRALMLAHMGRAEEGLAVLDRVLALDPGNARLKQSKATLLALEGRYEEASLLFQEVAEAMPYVPGLRARALNALFRVPDQTERAFQLGLVYMEERPDDYNVAGVLGVELANRGQYEPAIRLLELGILADRPEKDVAMKLAAVRFGRGQAESAEELLERELEHYPHNFAAFRSLLRIRGHLGKWETQVQQTGAFFAAQERLEKRIAERPELDNLRLSPPIVAEIWQIRAQALFNLQRYEEARRALDKGLALQPDGPALLVLQANLLKQEGKPEEALAAFEAAKVAKAREDEERAAKRLAHPRSGQGEAAAPPGN